MKVLITENRLHKTIEKYILNGYPMVKRVFFTTKKIRLASEPNEKGKNDIVRNIIEPSYIEDIKSNINLKNYWKQFSKNILVIF
jgi:hypothetical protein